MKILVLNPMTAATKNVVRDVVYGCWCNGKRIGGATVPPFMLITVATILRKSGFAADFLDAQAEQIPALEMTARIGQYDVVVMSTSTMSFKEDAEYLLKLKKAHPQQLTTVIFGSHPTFMPTYCLAHDGVDIVIKHEPEAIIKELMALMAEKKDYSGLQGIGYKNNGQPVVNADAPFISNLDEIPFPDVDLLPKGIDYFNPIVRRTPYMTATTSKGCPGQCTFCPAPVFDGQTIRFQSAEYVTREIDYFLSKGIKEIYFRDDTFFINRKRDHAIFQYIIQNKLDLTWLANARVNLMDADTMARAKEAGCHTIKFGIESGVQEILDGMKKGYTLARAGEVFGWAKKIKMNTHAHVMLGNPDDTQATLAKTIDFVLELEPTTVTFGICTPYPGTPLFDLVKSKFPEIGDGSGTDLSRLHVEGLFNEHYTSLTREELRQSVTYAYRKFYFRPKYWVNAIRSQIRGLDDVKRLSIAGTNVFNFMFNKG